MDITSIAERLLEELNASSSNASKLALETNLKAQGVVLLYQAIHKQAELEKEQGLVENLEVEAG